MKLNIITSILLSCLSLVTLSVAVDFERLWCGHLRYTQCENNDNVLGKNIWTTIFAKIWHNFGAERTQQDVSQQDYIKRKREVIDLGTAHDEERSGYHDSNRIIFLKPTPGVNIMDQLELQQKLQQQQPTQNNAPAPAGKKAKKKKKKKKKKGKRKKKNKNQNKNKLKNKLKKKRKNKKKKEKPPKKQHTTIGQTAHVIFASVTPKPTYWHKPYHPYPTTTKSPLMALVPTKKIKYLWKKHNVFKKKKKEYLNHVFHVFLPFLKFIAFFTVLNPFTLAVFLFSLISPVVFSFLGFAALSTLVKPFLHLLFDVKRRVGIIKRQKLRQLRRRHRHRQRRPITIHKHYYPKRPIHPPRHIPTLPHVHEKLRHASEDEFEPKFVRYEKIKYGG